MQRADILFINDGSTDNSKKILGEIGANYLDLPFNMGVGSAIKAGLNFARINSYDLVVQVDGDGQHDPAFIPKLLGEVLAGNDYVIGSRFGSNFSYPAGKMRILALWFISKLMSAICRQEISDATSGFRAFNWNAIEKLHNRFPSYYLGDTLEVLILAKSLGLRIAEVKVSMNPRFAGVPSHNPLQIAFQLGNAFYVIGLALINQKRAFKDRSKL
jgi:glycosyltransferase involved in cell wall biosynthesis